MPRATRQAGFTLIEILVVVIVIAIMIAVTVLNPGLLRSDRDLRTEAQRFAAIFTLAQDEGLLQGRDFGIELMRGGYRFVEYDPFNDIWVAVIGDELLNARQLPADLELELYVEDVRILLDDAAAELDDPEDSDSVGIGERYAPHVLLYSSGDTTPFAVDIVRPGDQSRVSLQVDALGTVEHLEDDQ